MRAEIARKSLWRKLGLDAHEMEGVFQAAKDMAKGKKPSKESKEIWMDKTERLFSFFDYYELSRPLHSKSGLPGLSSLAGYAAIWDELEKREVLVIEDPTGIKREDLIKFLARLGELAVQRQTRIELVILGGAAMVLGFSARVATLDIDAVILAPANKKEVQEMIIAVAEEFDLPDAWLNNAAQGFLRNISIGKNVFSGPGIEVNILKPEQLLATKLGAWRSKKDRLDAAHLLKEFQGLTREQVWEAIEPFLTPHQELKSNLAFIELWERMYGNPA